jgi:multicomponent Na+:H+ antiporter subunit B
MYSLILSSAARLLFPLLLMFSMYLLLRGHNEPGGGFVGGLIATSAFALHLLAYDAAETRRVLRIEPRLLVAIGLTVALASGLSGLASGGPFLTGSWHPRLLPVVTKLGTPFLFDVGVYLVVFGAAMTIILTLAED